jgi:uncharacterized iron-regulated membrane protein
MDQYTGAVLATYDYSGASVAGKLSNTWLAALHFGSFGGLPVRIAYLIVGSAPVLLLVTGVAVWWLRRADKPETKNPRDR